MSILRGTRPLVAWLSAAACAVAADWNAPAVYDLTTTVLNTNVPAWTATITDGPANSWITGGGFEPMVLRRKWHARGDSPNEILLTPSEIDAYNTLRDGVMDGAAVRVYRIENGLFRKVRSDTVAHFYATGWYAPEPYDWGTQVLASTSTTARVNFAAWYRKDADYHFKVVAVDTQGNVSPDSNIVTVHWNGWSGTQVPQTNALTNFTAPATRSETNAPPTPASLQASYDAVTGLISFSWGAVAAPDLAGYRLLYCDRPPASLNGYHIYLANSPADPALGIKSNDMVFLEMTRTNWDRGTLLGHRVYGTQQAGLLPPLVPYHNDAGKTWAFVPHPAPVPPQLAAVGGQTCLFMDVGTATTVQLAQYNHAQTLQDWYKILETGKTYVAECWLRQEGLPTGTVTFGLTGYYASRVPATNFVVNGTWQRFTTTFSVSQLYDTAGSVGQMRLQFVGPGHVWVDNFRVYEQGTDFMDFTPTDYAVLADSGLSFLRTHSHIKSGWGHTMADLTNPRGSVGSRGWQDSASQHTYESLFTMMHKAGVNPWLQVEFYMREDEWLGWAEYMAAPYNPAVDTPVSKPWAYKRYSQGHAAPWTDEFNRILFELSNETWNGLFTPWTFLGYTMQDRATGVSYGSGQLLGKWQDYVIGVIRSSPYWTPAVDAKFEWVVGGWDIQYGTTGYGPQAGVASTNTTHVTVAGYNGGWDEGEPPAEATDAGFFKSMVYGVQAGEPRAIQHAQTRNTLRSQGLAHYEIGTYEAGPGYNLNGLNGVSMTAEQVAAESKVMKSLAGGVATLDSFLVRARYGFRLQNFFTFERNRNYWVSHARWEKGGNVYPCWEALSLYNLHGAGDHLQVHCRTAPSYDLPKTTQRAALAGAPMASVYATRSGNRYTLFCLSRKLGGYPVLNDDGYTPLTVNLPFTLGPDATITLHRMAGNPRTNNLDAANVVAEHIPLPTNVFASAFALDAARGADARGLPPGSVFVYVFEGTQTAELPAAPQVRVEQAYDQADPNTSTTNSAVRFAVAFDRPVTGFGDSSGDLVFGGSAGFAGYAVEPVFGSGGTAYRVTVGPLLNSGTVSVSVPSGAAHATVGGAASAASTSIDNQVYGVVPGTVDLQLLLDSVAVGGTVVIEPGTYAQNLTISNSLDLLWNGFTLNGRLTFEGTTELGAQGQATLTELRVVDGASVTLAGARLALGTLTIEPHATLTITGGSLNVGGKTYAGSFRLTSQWADPPVAQALPFADDFESHLDGQPLAMLGEYGWSTTYGDVAVQAASVQQGQRAVTLPLQTDLDTLFNTPVQKVWTDLRVRPPLGIAPSDSPTADESLRLYFTGDGRVAIWRGGVWDVCALDASGNAVPPVSNQWVRISLHHDYATQRVAVFLNGRLLRAAVPFVGANASAYRRVTYRNEGGLGVTERSAYLDRVSSRTTLPEGLGQLVGDPADVGVDADGDGMTEAEEIDRYGDLTTFRGQGYISVIIVR